MRHFSNRWFIKLAETRYSRTKSKNGICSESFCYEKISTVSKQCNIVHMDLVNQRNIIKLKELSTMVTLMEIKISVTHLLPLNDVRFRSCKSFDAHVIRQARIVSHGTIDDLQLNSSSIESWLHERSG